MKTITRKMMTVVLLVVVVLTASAQGPVTTATIDKPKNEKKKNVTLPNYKGTMTRHGTKMEYTFHGGLITKKEIKGQGTYYMIESIGGQVEAGKTVTASFKKLIDYSKVGNLVNVHITATTTDGKVIGLDDKSGKQSASVSAKVPTNAKEVSISMEYTGKATICSCHITLTVVKDLSETQTKSFKWDDVAEDDRCKHCKGQFSNYFVGAGYFEGDWVMLYCDSYPKESVRGYLGTYYSAIYYRDHIETGSKKLILDYCDEEGALTLMESTSVLLRNRLANGKDRWEVFKGTIVGKNLKHAESEFEMSSCTAKPTGTTYVLQDDGKTSHVYLLEGSMEVTSKKGSKKTTLKPGQAATVTKQGQMSVNSFDVGAMAKKYNISGVSSTMTTTQDKNNRYEVKCAVVKYKYTEGKVTGQQERAFDNYGKLERRHEKTSKQETYLYIRDNKNYNLNVKKKTMTVKADNQLNFRNPNESRIKKTDKRKTATILGKTCTLYQTSSSDYWVWKGIVLKKVDHKKDGTQAIIEATSIQTPASLPASTFEVPKGYKTK